MNPDDGPDRLYVCPGCSSPERGPFQGGEATCSRCETRYLLPARTPSPAKDGPPRPPLSDPGRLAELRTQIGRPRLPSPALQAVLGGANIQPGREAEAITVWQSLRGRSHQGDVAASEDLTLLTLMLVQHPSVQSQPLLERALGESALDAVILPRHRQEQLGRLSRTAAAGNDRVTAERMLAAMIPGSNELDTDSEYRISAAVIAAMGGDARGILELLGAGRDAIPISAAIGPLASVFRAHAYELAGDLDTAQHILRQEIPDPQVTELVAARFASLDLCPRSRQAFVAGFNEAAGQRAAASAGRLGIVTGAILAVVGVIELAVGAVVLVAAGGGGGAIAGLINGVIGLGLTIAGAIIVVRSRAKARRAAWLRVHGLSLPARVTEAGRTGVEINDVPVYRLHLQVNGPYGPYAASIKKLLPDFRVAMIIGSELRVRVNPDDPNELILEE